jgi:6-phosphogluconolactonase
MRVEICPTADAANTTAASLIAQTILQAVDERGRCTLALSGGRTPASMIAKLAAAELPWADIHVAQVDERIVGDDDGRRNLIGIRDAFARSPLAWQNVHGMPVERMPPEAGAMAYAKDLEAIAGHPSRIDIVHLGLGDDGHTASLVPSDAALESTADVAVTGEYQGTRRMTLTLATLNRARCRIWLVTGRSKRDVVRQFLARDPTLVASRLNTDATIVVLDKDSAGV